MAQTDAIRSTTREPSFNRSSSDDYARLLKSCSKARDLVSGRKIHASILASTNASVAQSRFLANLLMDMYGKCGSLDEAQSVFDAIEEPNLHSWSILAAAYSQNGRLAEAHDTIAKMPEGRQQTLVAQNTLLAAYGRQGCVEEARKIFDGMRQHDSISWNSMLSAYAQAGQGREAKALFAKIPSPDVVSWTLLISALSSQSLLVEAKACFDTMPLRPNLVTWTTLIAAFASAGHLVEARSWFDALASPDIVLCTAMVKAYGESGRVKEARELFNSMQLRNLVSWNVMLAAYAQSGYVSEAFAIFSDMPELDRISWTTMLVMQAEAGNIEQATSLFKLIPEKDAVAWNAMMAAYVKQGHLDEAVATFESMPCPDVVSWNSLLAAYGQKGRLEEARQLLSFMPYCDEVTWTTMVAAYAQRGYLCEARLIFDQASRQLPFGVQVWNLMLEAYCQFGDVVDAWQFFHAMPDKDVVTWTTMVTACAQRAEVQHSRTLFDRLPLCRDAAAWNAMMAACAMNAHCVECMDLVKEMEMEGALVNEVAFLAVLSTCGHAGWVAEVRSYFCKMRVDYGLEPSLDHFSCVVDGFARAGDLVKAQDLIRSMPFLPDSTIMTSVLAAGGRLGTLRDYACMNSK